MGCGECPTTRPPHFYSLAKRKRNFRGIKIDLFGVHWHWANVETKVRRYPRRSRNRLTTVALARVLLVDDNPTSRLTLKTVLEASGYSVDSAASAAEAFGKMDQKSYELILSDLQMESPEAGLKVLARARIMEYEPATALITAYQQSARSSPRAQNLTIETQDVPEILTKVAELISERATRRLERQMRQAAAAAS